MGVPQGEPELRRTQRGCWRRLRSRRRRSLKNEYGSEKWGWLKPCWLRRELRSVERAALMVDPEQVEL